MCYVCDIRLHLNEGVSAPRYANSKSWHRKWLKSLISIVKTWVEYHLYYVSLTLGSNYVGWVLLSMTYGDDVTSYMVHGDCQRIVKEYEARYTLAIGPPRYSTSSLGTFHYIPSSVFHKSLTEWTSMFTSSVNVGNEEVKDELDTYVDEKLMPFNVKEHFDVLAS